MRFISQDSYRGEQKDVNTWHLYQYCMGNPINYIDPSGHKAQDIRSKISAKSVSVYIGVHAVMMGAYHSSIFIFAQPKSKFYKHKYFKNSTKNAKYGGQGKAVKYATIGAGPTGPITNSKLASKRNRDEDVKLNNKKEMIYVKSYTNKTMVKRLFKLERHYRKNKKNVNYGLFPKIMPGYNSNSFVSGLLIAAGINIPHAPKNTVPGFDVPLPMHYFGAGTISRPK